MQNEFDLKIPAESKDMTLDGIVIVLREELDHDLCLRLVPVHVTNGEGRIAIPIHFHDFACFFDSFIDGIEDRLSEVSDPFELRLSRRFFETGSFFSVSCFMRLDRSTPFGGLE